MQFIVLAHLTGHRIPRIDNSRPISESKFVGLSHIQDKCKKNCCFITTCKAHSKVTHIKQLKYFHYLKRPVLDIIGLQSFYYIHGPLGDENIFAVLYVSLCYGPYTLL